ncbi:MAG: AMP-binding protein, partial [Acidimicrobiales bacterium]
RHQQQQRDGYEKQPPRARPQRRHIRRAQRLAQQRPQRVRDAIHPTRGARQVGLSELDPPGKAQRQQPDTPLFADVRGFPGGGAPKPPQLHYDLMAEMGGVGILSGYGLTEAPILTLVDVDDSDEAKADTEGRPMPGVELRLVSMADGSICGPGEEGEIRAKAPQLMRGYLDASLDEDAFDDDGYFRSGDLGVQDEDGNLTMDDEAG